MQTTLLVTVLMTLIASAALANLTTLTSSSLAFTGLALDI